MVALQYRSFQMLKFLVLHQDMAGAGGKKHKSNSDLVSILQGWFLMHRKNTLEFGMGREFHTQL